MKDSSFKEKHRECRGGQENEAGPKAADSGGFSKKNGLYYWSLLTVTLLLHAQRNMLADVGYESSCRLAGVVKNLLLRIELEE